ncbi:MAG: TMEM165/GDT1 family protein, partial [Acidimicrobiales bacterium]
FTPVYLGVGLALSVQAAIAVVAGRLLTLLPHTTVESIVAALFVCGAAYLIFVPEKAELAKGERLGGDRGPTGQIEASDGAVQEGTPNGADQGGTPDGRATQAPGARPAMTDWRVFLTAFTVVALAEFGDITQVLIANLSARYRDPWSVFAGAVVAFWLVAALGVVAGKTITRYVPLGVVRRLSGLALLGFGIWTIVGLL